MLPECGGEQEHQKLQTDKQQKYNSAFSKITFLNSSHNDKVKNVLEKDLSSENSILQTERSGPEVAEVEIEAVPTKVVCQIIEDEEQKEGNCENRRSRPIGNDEGLCKHKSYLDLTSVGFKSVTTTGSCYDSMEAYKAIGSNGSTNDSVRKKRLYPGDGSFRSGGVYSCSVRNMIKSFEHISFNSNKNQRHNGPQVSHHNSNEEANNNTNKLSQQTISPRRNDETQHGSPSLLNGSIIVPPTTPNLSSTATSPQSDNNNSSGLLNHSSSINSSTVSPRGDLSNSALHSSVPSAAAAATAAVSPSNSSSNQLLSLIPKFYYPSGVPQSPLQVQHTLSLLRDAFEKLPNKKANKFNIQSIMTICELPLYCRLPLLSKCKVTDPETNYVSADTFISTWKNIIKDAHDVETRFVRVMSKTCADYIVAADFEEMLQDVVDTHTGLRFLQEAKEFHARYITTVISRIFYTVNRSWSGKLTVTEIRNSNLIQTLEQLQVEEEINRIRDFFSYEHFYVIYCKFWDLDLDRDLMVSHADLCKHEAHAVSQKVIDRIFQGTVSRELTNKSMKMSYGDFVWFLISEEDKQSATSIEYWFRVMDLDGDGVLSMYELEYFWEEQLQRMIQQEFADLLPFEDILCEMLDLVKPAVAGKITLSDLKKCKLSHVFFNTFINFKKFMDIQQKQNSGSFRDEEDSGLTDWERYANEEYDRLVSEEGDQGSYMSYEDDFEQPNDDSSSPITSPAAKDYAIEPPIEQMVVAP